MRIFQSGINTLHISNQILREHGKFGTFRDVPLDANVRYLTWRAYDDLCDFNKSEDVSKFQDACRVISKKGDDFRVGILYAHGTYLFGKWCYQDGLFPKSVQRWIDKYDGVYDLLLLQVCNPRHVKPVIKKSIAIVPTNAVGPLWKDDVKHHIVIPGRNIDMDFNLETLLSMQGEHLR